MNEDSLLVIPERGLFLVCDGVGGRRGGQFASQTVVEIFRKVFSQDQPDDLREVIGSTIDLCNQKLYVESATNPELEGMATTIALAAVDGNRAVIAHVGDSRVYRYDDQGLIGLTEDHSEVNEALRSGVITEEQAANYPRRNVINRAIGADADVEPDMIEIEIDDQTSLILCSDGITRHITDDEIARLMKSGRRPQAICELMKELCFEGGAEDNLTVVVVDFGERDYVEEPTRPARAVQPQAAVPSGAAFPRPVKRIEVSLSETTESGSAIPPPTGPSGEAAKESSTVLHQDLSGRKSVLPKKGELSKAMKWSLLAVALIVGVLIGSLFGKPITDRLDRLFGNRAIYDKAGIERPPGDPEVNAAYARHLEGKSDEARDRLNKVLTNNPNHAEANFYLGLIDYDQTRFDESINHLSQAAKLDPSLPNVQIRLAMAYLSIGQMRNARDVLQNVVKPAGQVAPGAAASPAVSPAAAGSPTPAPGASPANQKPAGAKPVG